MLLSASFSWMTQHLVVSIITKQVGAATFEIPLFLPHRLWKSPWLLARTTTLPFLHSLVHFRTGAEVQIPFWTLVKIKLPENKKKLAQSTLLVLKNIKVFKKVQNTREI